MNTLSRRDFTLRSMMAALAGVAITVTGCSSDDGNPGGPDPPASGDEVGTISANHGHTAVITAAQLTAAAALMLGIRGGADHDHVVELSAAEVGQIAGGQRVSKGSTSSQAHTHTVTFN